MDRLLEQNYRACVRDTMMRQEEIFKQQVHDLHHVYQVQKALMTELRVDTKNKYWSNTSPSETSHSSCIISNRHHYNKMVEEPSISHRGFDPEQLVEVNATTPCVQSKELWVDEECEVELTLSVGCSSSKKKLRNLQPSEMRGPLWSQARKRNEISEECIDRESLQRPPWLFQAEF